MKFRRPILIFLAVALLMTGCSSVAPTATTTTTTVVTSTTAAAPAAEPGDGAALTRAAEALNEWIPEGLL